MAAAQRFFHVDVLLAQASASDLERLARGRHFLERLANLASLRPLGAGEPEPESAVALLGELRILVPMAGLIDVAAEAARLEKRIDGFGELFRSLSFAEIGAAAMLSRAVAGVARGRIVASLPGSTAAVELAMTRLLVPELSHMVGLVRGGG